MLISLLFFTLSASLLFLTSQALTKLLIKTFYRLTHSRTASLNLLFFLLLPGILIHELSHIITAELLQVRTGELSLKPHWDESGIKLGSAQIAKTDPLRLTLIGTAPFIIGSTILYFILRFSLKLILPISSLSQSFLIIRSTPLLILVISFYFLFAISNTMFSSTSDLQSAAFPIILFLLILGLFQLTHLTLPPAFIAYSTSFFYLLTSTFSFILILNLFILLPLKLIFR